MGSYWCAMKHIFTSFCMFRHYGLDISLAFITFAVITIKDYRLTFNETQ